MNITILRFDTLDSTNTEAANHACKGADEGLCVVARHQTAGRGRHGRTWVSEKDSGLYFSIVLRPKFDTKHLPLITLMAGVAVYDTLKEIGLEPNIKWVNDLLVGEKKIVGILAETVETPTGLAVIVGIGVNLTSRNFPDEIADTATSIEAETAKKIASDEIAEILTRYLIYFYEMLKQEDRRSEILSEWQKRSSYFSGKSVRVALADNVIEGVTDGLEQNGALRVKTDDGSVKIVQAGDVTRLRSQ
jgi:BirA family transcriptional regulator, biotin operon repressor / biotin---[acetyl-CoA-carboxylase] ligase